MIIRAQSETVAIALSSAQLDTDLLQRLEHLASRYLSTSSFVYTSHTIAL